MKLAIAIAATKSYLYAWEACLRSVAAAAAHRRDVHFIFATDESAESKAAEEVAKRELPEGWQITVIRMKFQDDPKDYGKSAQLRIAALQGAAFACARTKVRADRLWSVESDNIVPANALRVLEWTLDMPTEDGTPYYDIAAGTYTNGMFLGGFGSYQNPIAEDFLPEERKVPRRLRFLLDECGKRLKGNLVPFMQSSDPDKAPLQWVTRPENGMDENGQPIIGARMFLEKEERRMRRLAARVKKCPPNGNIWQVIQNHGWRRRGWMDNAYPGIGQGAVVPSDWCGLGCTLMSARALALADFCGYDGGGTQDLYLCWHRWHPAGLRLACVPHVACGHVKRQGDGIVHHIAYHEPQGECRGHLRVRSVPWMG